MELVLTDDQEFFRDTTRKFLGERVPDRQGPRARARTTPASSPTTGARAPSSGGRRCSCPRSSGAAASSGNGAVRPRPRRRRVRLPRRARPAAPVQRRRRRAGPLGQRASSSRRSAPGADRRASRSPRGPITEPAPHDRLGDVAAARRGRRRRLRAHRREVAGRGGRPGRPAPRHRHAPTPASRSSWCRPTPTGVTITPLRSVDLVRRYARVEFDGVKVAGRRAGRRAG